MCIVHSWWYLMFPEAVRSPKTTVQSIVSHHVGTEFQTLNPIIELSSLQHWALFTFCKWVVSRQHWKSECFFSSQSVFLGACTRDDLGHSGQSCNHRATSLKAMYLPAACWGFGCVGSWVCVSRASSDVKRYKLWLPLGQHGRKLGWAQQGRMEMENFKERVSGAGVVWQHV